MDVSTANVSVNNIQFTLSGSHDADDLTTANVYFNASAPVLAGASYLGNTAATFAAPHAYSININRSLTAATSGYFIISLNVNAAASTGKTVQVNGLANPVIFGYTTAPNVTNSQTNTAGVKTISASFATPQAIAETSNIAAASEQTVFSGMVYPNPANAMLAAGFTATSRQKVTIQITGTNGKVVSFKTLTADQGGNKINMEVRSITAGMYHIRVRADNGEVYLDKK